MNKIHKPAGIHLLLFSSLAFLLTACGSSTEIPPTAAPPTQITKASYPDLGEAPELTNDVWLNTEAPLRLAELRGKVVLIDMWTFG